MTYEGFDSRGHAHGKVDGESDLAFTYDRAERVTKIDEGNGLERPLKSFEYSTTVAANDWRKGKLRKAKRYNYFVFDPVLPPDAIFLDDFECGDLSAWSAAEGTTLPVGGTSCNRTAATVVVEETYTYGGVGGRVSQRDTAIALNGSTGETFTQGCSAPWGAGGENCSYTELGDVASVTYPACNFNRCTSDAGAGFARSVGLSCNRTASTVVVQETFTCGGGGGRVSRRDTAITLDGNTGETFTEGERHLPRLQLQSLTVYASSTAGLSDDTEFDLDLTVGYVLRF